MNQELICNKGDIVALRNEKGSYNAGRGWQRGGAIVALRNEKGSYNTGPPEVACVSIVALRNEKGSYNIERKAIGLKQYCSTAK